MSDEVEQALWRYITSWVLCPLCDDLVHKDGLADHVVEHRDRFNRLFGRMAKPSDEDMPNPLGHPTPITNPPHKPAPQNLSTPTPDRQAAHTADTTTQPPAATR